MAVLSGSSAGVSGTAMGRPHAEQKRTFSEDTAPQPEQVTIRRGLYRTTKQGKATSGIRRPLAFESRVTWDVVDTTCVETGFLLESRVPGAFDKLKLGIETAGRGHSRQELSSDHAVDA
jgi:hypothetical protein